MAVQRIRGPTLLEHQQSRSGTELLILPLKKDAIWTSKGKVGDGHGKTSTAEEVLLRGGFVVHYTIFCTQDYLGPFLFIRERTNYILAFFLVFSPWRRWSRVIYGSLAAQRIITDHWPKIN